MSLLALSGSIHDMLSHDVLSHAGLNHVGLSHDALNHDALSDVMSSQGLLSCKFTAG